MLKSRSTTRRLILPTCWLRGAYYPCASYATMLFRHSTLLPASAERPSRFQASAARHTARGNTCKWTLATLLPANLSRRVVEEVVDHHLVPPDERTSGAQSAGAIEAFSAPQMFPPQSSGRPRRVLRIHAWKVIGVNKSCTVGKGMDGSPQLVITVCEGSDETDCASIADPHGLAIRQPFLRKKWRSSRWGLICRSAGRHRRRRAGRSCRVMAD